MEYSAEFVPSAEGSYIIAVEKPRKIGGTEEAIHNSFTSKEAGKMVLSVDNTASRKKKVAAYRYVVRKCSTIWDAIKPQIVIGAIWSFACDVSSIFFVGYVAELVKAYIKGTWLVY